MVFGSFDVLHKGHFFLLDYAKKQGDLTIVVALDETIKSIKNITPHYSQNIRAKHLGCKYPHATVLIGKSDKMYWLREIKPDLVVLGYDQSAFVNRLKNFAEQFGTQIKVMPAFKPERYKSSMVKSSKLRFWWYRLFR